MKMYKIIDTTTEKIVRYCEANSKRNASAGKMTQERVELILNEKQYKEHLQLGVDAKK